MSSGVFVLSYVVIVWAWGLMCLCVLSVRYSVMLHGVCSFVLFVCFDCLCCLFV